MLQFVMAYVMAAFRVSRSYGQALLDELKSVDPRLAGLTETFATGATGKDRGQLGLGTVIAALTVAIAAMAAVLVLDNFDTSIGDPTNSDLNNSSDSILSGFSDMADLIGPLFLIAIVVVIIGLLRRVNNT